eukprot:8008582-Alexandrium_andersonii.AAC.1
MYNTRPDGGEPPPPAAFPPPPPTMEGVGLGEGGDLAGAMNAATEAVIGQVFPQLAPAAGGPPMLPTAASPA